mgnify:CR=1 FL=1
MLPLAAPSAGFPAGQGFSSSSNGFGGFTPSSAGEDTQENYAVYLDLEADVTERLVLQAAVRYEDFYDTYGATTNYKLGALYHVTDDTTLAVVVGGRDAQGRWRERGLDRATPALVHVHVAAGDRRQ